MIKINGMFNGNIVDLEISNADPEGLAKFVAAYTAEMFRTVVQQSPAMIQWISSEVPKVVQTILDQAECNVPLYVKLGHELERRVKRIGDLYSKAYSSLIRKEKVS